MVYIHLIINYVMYSRCFTMSRSWHIVVVDVEASGHLRTFKGETPYHNLLEIGAVYVELSRSPHIISELYVVLKPVTSHYEEEAIRHTYGKNMEYYKRFGVEPIRGMEKFYRFIKGIYDKTGRKVLLASDNPEFDVGWIRLYLELFGFDHAIIHHNPMSIKDLARGLTKNIWVNLYKLPRKYNVDLPHTHKAIDDARRNAHILMKLSQDLF